MGSPFQGEMPDRGKSLMPRPWSAPDAGQNTQSYGLRGARPGMVRRGERTVD